MQNEPTVGRIVHAYSNRWSGPRPAIIVRVFREPIDSGGDNPVLTTTVDARVFTDPVRDPNVFANRSCGDTMVNQPVYEPLSMEKRRAALADAPYEPISDFRAILEWPAIPGRSN